MSTCNSKGKASARRSLTILNIGSAATAMTVYADTLSSMLSIATCPLLLREERIHAPVCYGGGRTCSIRQKRRQAEFPCDVLRPEAVAAKPVIVSAVQENIGQYHRPFNLRIEGRTIFRLLTIADRRVE